MGYAPPPSWPPASPASPAEPVAPGAAATLTTPAPRSRVAWAALPLPLITSVVISAGVVLLFIANLLIAVGEPNGTPGDVRILQFLSPADVAVGVVLVVAMALVELAGRAEAPPEPASSVLGPADVRLIAGVVSATVAMAALIRAIVSLTIAHQPAAIKVGNMIDAVAAMVVAAVAALWAIKPK